jgi:hypothetical protein
MQSLGEAVPLAASVSCSAKEATCSFRYSPSAYRPSRQIDSYGDALATQQHTGEQICIGVGKGTA